MQLNSGHIEFIREDIQRRGLVHDDLLEELLDHFCSMTEARMAGGERFFEAYRGALREFGAGTTLRNIQNNRLNIQQQPKIMLRNYITIAWRNLHRHKFYSIINIFGLSVGIATSLLIVLFIIDELSFDKFHSEGDRIFRVTSDIKFGENDFSFPLTPAPLAETMKLDYPEVEEAVRLRDNGSYLVRAEDGTENFNVDKVLFCDPGFFNLFSFELIHGSRNTVLDGPDKTAISESLALKIFGTTDVLGRNILYDGQQLMQITGVFRDMPANSHFKSDALVSMASTEEALSTVWLSNNFYTYLRLRPDTPADALEKKLPAMVDQYLGPQVKQFTGMTFEEAKANGSKVVYELQPLQEIHLHSHFKYELGSNGDIRYVYIFTAVAAFIILLACINFMNLSTARSSTRAREVGIRKVLGSIRGHLVRQFLTESVMITAIATITAIGIAAIAVPVFNSVIGKQIAIPFGSPVMYLILILTILLLGFAAGIYPSLFLSSYKPVQVLKGRLLSGRSGAPVRSLLVIGQFAITIILLMATAAVYKQLYYIQHKKLGFTKEQVLLVRDTYMLGEKVHAFKNNVLQNSSIVSSGISGYLPIENSNRSDMTYWEEGKEITEDNMVNAQTWTVDNGYIETFGLEIVEGRAFSNDYISDSTAVILNERAVKSFGLQNPIGARIETFDNFEVENKSYITYHVVGVVRDFHFNNMRQAISPLIFHLGNNSSVVSFRFISDDVQAVVTTAEAEWNKISNGTPFNYSFLDQEFSKMYNAEKQLGEIFILFASLATIIGGLGLFGLAAYLTEQRTREIGIRKVLGASNGGILWLVSKNFGKLILIAFFIAIPVSWYFIRNWLLDFEYKTTVGWEMYLLVGLATLLIAGLTISYQTIRAALTNPAETIRNE